MDSLSPANQALIAKMQNNQVQVQAQTQTSKAPELPTDSVELSTSVKKPKNKMAMIIGGLVAGVAVAASLITAYKKGVFFKLEGAILKKEADKAYQKAQVVVEEVAELINKGLNEGLEEFTDKKTGRTVKILGNTIKEYDGDSIAREAWFDFVDNVANIKEIDIHKKGKLNTIIDLSENEIDAIRKGITRDENRNIIKISRFFNYGENIHYKNLNCKSYAYKGFQYNSDGKVTNYAKQTKTHSTEWSQEDGLKREKPIKPEVDIEPEEEISVEEDFTEEDFIDEPPVAEEDPIDIDDFIIVGKEDFAE